MAIFSFIGIKEILFKERQETKQTSPKRWKEKSNKTRKTQRLHILIPMEYHSISSNNSPIGDPIKKKLVDKVTMMRTTQRLMYMSPHKRDRFKLACYVKLIRILWCGHGRPSGTHTWLGGVHMRRPERNTFGHIMESFSCY